MSSGMKLTDQIKQCRNPMEAMLLLAAKLDEIELAAGDVDPWASPLTWDDAPTHVANVLGPITAAPDNRAQIIDGDVVVKPVSGERKTARYCFALDKRLAEVYGPALSTEAFVDAYVKGGPRWLYYTNRACVMQMPLDVRQQLVADVLLDSPSEADEIGRDILKFDESAAEGTQIDWQRAARDLGPLA